MTMNRDIVDPEEAASADDDENGGFAEDLAQALEFADAEKSFRPALADRMTS